MNSSNYSYNQEVVNILLKVNAIKQCLLHPDSYIKVMDNMPRKAYAYAANYLKEIRPIEMSFEEFASLIEDTFKILPEECWECMKLAEEKK